MDFSEKILKEAERLREYIRPHPHTQEEILCLRSDEPKYYIVAGLSILCEQIESITKNIENLRVPADEEQNMGTI